MTANEDPQITPMINRTLQTHSKFPKTTIIYHRADYDGIASGLIVELWLRRKNLVSDETLTMIGWDYNDPAPDVTGCESLWMVDISVPSLMDHPGLTWIDHHKTAIDQYPGRWGYQLDGVAACRLAWQFMAIVADEEVFRAGFPTKQEFVDRVVKEPLLVRLLGEYDVWDKRDPRAEQIQLGLRATMDEREWLEEHLGDLVVEWSKSDLSSYQELAVDDLVSRGESVQVYAERQNRLYVARAHDLKWQGLTFLCLNHSMGNSLTFEAGLDSRHDACLMWRFDGNKVNVSLYGVPSRPDVDLSQIARLYGGGGHRQACGFSVDLSKWCMVLNGTSVC